MIFAHGGVLCPLDVAAAFYGLPMASVAWYWISHKIRSKRRG